MTRIAPFALLLVVLLAVPVHARPGVVKTNDGQTYEGEVDERDPAVVVVVIKGIQTRIDRSRVASIAYSGNKQQELATRLSKLDARDVNGRITLARDAMSQQQYTMARDALEQARLIDPNNAEVVTLLETVQSQIRMERNRQRPAEPAPAQPAQPRPGVGPNTIAATTEATQPAGDLKLLRPAEINAIRQAETRFPEDNVRIRFERNVLRRFVDYIGRDELPAFFSLNQLQQANLILEKGPPEMWQDVTILNDPPALLYYRRTVQPFVVTNCATVACHGGSAKPHIVTPAESEAATYTNFYTLSKHVKQSPESDGSVFGRPNPRLVDRQRPEQSLLIQYSLPGAISEYDHPDVEGYRPALKTKAEPRYRQLQDWMGQYLKLVEPRYTFEPVATMQATQPATQPVTVPAVTPPARPTPPTPPARPAPPARPGRPAAPPPPPDGVLR